MPSSTTLSPSTYRRFSLAATRPDPVAAAAAATSGPNVDPECLPAYTRRASLIHPPSSYRDGTTRGPREPIEHTFSLMTDGGYTSSGHRQAWATLNLRSSAKSSKSMPTFYEKEHINGSLHIDADKTDSIQAISAIITGRISSSSSSSSMSSGDLQFLNIVVPIWTRNSSEQSSRTPSPSTGSSSTSSPGSSSGKLRGKCSWPLSIPIPKESTVPVKGSTSGSKSSTMTCRLPETFNERGYGVFVQYELCIKITRGKLKSDAKLSTSFAYVPSTRPEAPSALRQLAYQENSPLPGPQVDPEGWKSFPTVSIRGSLFKSKKTQAKLTLSIAKPLSYTRGSVVPCSVVLESPDRQLLDLLSSSSSQALPLHIQRTVQHYSKGGAPTLPTQPHAFLGGASHPGWNKQSSIVGSAVWWRVPPAYDSHSNDARRYLEGEIRLAKDLKPSCSVGHFSISYHVVLPSLQISGFAMSESSSPSSSPLLVSDPVDITTKYAHGPRPLAYSPPPVYSSSSSSHARHDVASLLATTTTNTATIPSYSNPSTRRSRTDSSSHLDLLPGSVCATAFACGHF